MQKKILEFEKEDYARNFLKVAAAISFVVMTVIGAYGIVSAIKEYLTVGVVTIGTWFVEIEWPFQHFAKPITYLSVSMVVFTFSVLELRKHKLAELQRFSRSFYALIALVVAFVSFYEMLYNFVVWNALITADAVRGIIAIDNQNIAYPDPKIPWNLPFATKIFCSSFFVGLIIFYYLWKTDPERHKKEA